MANNDQIRPEDYYNVDGYYDKVHRTTWARRTAATMTGATMGLIGGSIVGLVAAYVPCVLGALGISGVLAAAGLPAFSAVAASVALFAGVAGFLGMVINAGVSENAASVSAGLEEMEKRQKIQKAEEAGLKRDAAALQSIAKHDAPEEKRPKLFSWKVGIITATMFAAFGALIAIDPISASKVALLGFKEGSMAAVLSSAAIFGTFGSFIGVKNSYISNKLNNFYFKLITEQYFTKNPAPEISPQPEKSSNPGYVMEESLAATKSFSDGKKRFSLSDLITRRQEGTAQDITITR